VSTNPNKHVHIRYYNIAEKAVSAIKVLFFKFEREAQISMKSGLLREFAIKNSADGDPEG
jgi:hypothetical protein